MAFDSQLIEAKLALEMIGPNEMPPLAWEASEAGLDGPAIRRLAALVNPSGWETDQIKPRFMMEAGPKSIAREEASVRLARHLAQRILSEGLDPLSYSRDFERLWIRADYAAEIQDAGLLDEEKAVAEYMARSEAELREHARNVLLALVKEREPNL